MKFQARFLHLCGFVVLVNKDKEGKYAAMVTSKFEKKYLELEYLQAVFTRMFRLNSPIRKTS